MKFFHEFGREIKDRTNLDNEKVAVLLSCGHTMIIHRQVPLFHLRGLNVDFMYIDTLEEVPCQKCFEDA